jgi:ribosomal-protein-alanine N-acetyltransferase
VLPLITDFDIRLAVAADARHIAEMSRDSIEVGLGWRWTPERILATLRDRDTNVAVAYEGRQLTGFGIMTYRSDEAHLLLLAVHPGRRRRGLGAALLRWLEDSARVAGIGVVHLEARACNRHARAFYRALGYREIRMLLRRYGGVEDGVHIAKDLWLNN